MRRCPVDVKAGETTSPPPGEVPIRMLYVNALSGVPPPFDARQQVPGKLVLSLHTLDHRQGNEKLSEEECKRARCCVHPHGVFSFSASVVGR